MNWSITNQITVSDFMTDQEQESVSKIAGYSPTFRQIAFCFRGVRWGNNRRRAAASRAGNPPLFKALFKSLRASKTSALWKPPRLENLRSLKTSAPPKPPHPQNLRCSQTPQGLGILKTRNPQTTFLPPSSHLWVWWFEFCDYARTSRCALS